MEYTIINNNLLDTINDSCLLISHLIVTFIFTKFLNNMINNKNVISLSIITIFNDTELFTKKQKILLNKLFKFRKHNI